MGRKSLSAGVPAKDEISRTIDSMQISQRLAQVSPLAIGPASSDVDLQIAALEAIQDRRG